MVTHFELLKIWCDGLIKRQITDIEDKGACGGIICPACSIIHGRSYGLVHPLLYLSEKTGDEKYIKSAELLIDWAEHVRCPDGSFVNDTMAKWKGITVFSAISLTKSLDKYGRLLSVGSKNKLFGLVLGCYKYIYNDFDVFSGNVNYLIGAAYALELGGKFFNNKDYTIKAKEYAYMFTDYIAENGLIFGESGKTFNQISKKGCLPVDIGYNVTESINLLTLYAVSAGDDYLLGCALKSAAAHLPFFLSDGGWDCSFSTRMDKWTYWGSRTTDGCQLCYTILSRLDKRLENVAVKNLELLYKCTCGGLLHGGRDLAVHKEPPCAHHSFTHAEGLTALLEWSEENNIQLKTDKEISAFEQKEEIYYRELDTYIFSTSKWRGTITGYDLNYSKSGCHPTGGALSLLYHKNAGIILASSMSVYNRYEPFNTQRHKDDVDNPLTLRAHIKEDNTLYSNIMDTTAVIKRNSELNYSVKGKIVDALLNSPESGEVLIEVNYNITDEEVIIEFFHNGKNVDIIIPVVLPDNNYTTFVTANQPLKKEGIFNHVPGFEAEQHKIVNADKYTKVTIGVRRVNLEK